MTIKKVKNITLTRVVLIFLSGLISGIQIALYLFDFYEDGIADIKSLFIGILFIIISFVFILFTFSTGKKA